MRGLVGLGDVAEAAGSTGHSQPGERAEANPAASHSVLRQAQACYYEALRTARDITAVPWMLDPACNHRTRQRASSLLSRLEAELPAAVVRQAEERGRHSQLEAAVQHLLEQPLPPA